MIRSASCRSTRLSIVVGRAWRSALASVLVGASLLATAPARAHGVEQTASVLSAISTLPVAVSVGAGALVLTGGAVLTVTAVQGSVNGTVWVLERVSDGARSSLRFSGKVIQGASVGVGTVVTVTALSTGFLISAASQAIAFVPNELGASLLFNERVSR